MNLWVLILNYLKSRPLNTALNILLLALGIAMISILVVFNRQFQEKITSNSKGIDLVVGAKGSPMQLILCNIFHVDFPTGNIRLVEAERVARHRLVKRAIPLALGDNYRGFRIIGTSHDYADLYDAKLSQGSLWKEPMEVVIGSDVARALQLSLGSQFTSSHGLSDETHAHDEQQFVVKGILQKANNVVDNLILTGVESIWQVHAVHDETTSSDQSPVRDSSGSSLVPSVAQGDSSKEITAMLVQYRSAMGAIQLPRWVNSQSSLQAASPAFETARLFSILGVGVDILKGFAAVLVFISALSIFIALYNSLKERRYDLAIMRSMGASRTKVFISVLLEGTVLALAGAVVGIVLAHSVMAGISMFVQEARMAGISSLVFYPEEGLILAGSLLLGVVCSMLPAWQAYRIDISRVLAGA
jgi:putative ABC transport system permease protein